jgi:hypothetical protein
MQEDIRKGQDVRAYIIIVIKYIKVVKINKLY